MTVVVALTGKDAIVLASDSQETAGMTKSYMQKLYAISEGMAWGGSGETALLQRVASFHHNIAPKIADPSSWETAKAIEAVTSPIQQTAYSTKLGAGDAPTFAGIFCWYDADGIPRIYQVYPNVASNQFRVGGRAAVGSGQAFAEVALASVAHLQLQTLDTERLEMVAYKSIYDVIVTSSFGVGWPVNLAVVTPGSARLLNTEEVGAVRDSVFAWFERQREALGPLVPSAEPLSETEIDLTTSDTETKDDPPEDPGIDPVTN